jgi:hypothetical protein
LVENSDIGAMLNEASTTMLNKARNDRLAAFEVLCTSAALKIKTNIIKAKM